MCLATFVFMLTTLFHAAIFLAFTGNITLRQVGGGAPATAARVLAVPAEPAAQMSSQVHSLFN